MASLNSQHQQLPINTPVMFEEQRLIESDETNAPETAADGPTANENGVELTPADATPETADGPTANENGVESTRPNGAVRPKTSTAVQQTKLQRFRSFFITNFLPIGFMFILIISLSAPYPGAVVASWKFLGGIGIVQAINNVLVFFISGLTLNTKEALDAAKQFRSLMLGMVSILFVTPMLAFIVRYIPFRPQEFGIGLTIFCTVPTTLGVGVALTVASGGNHALSLLLTVSTNILGIFSVPFLLQFILSSGQLQFDVVTPPLPPSPSLHSHPFSLSF